MRLFGAQARFLRAAASAPTEARETPSGTMAARAMHITGPALMLFIFFRYQFDFRPPTRTARRYVMKILFDYSAPPRLFASPGLALRARRCEGRRRRAAQYHRRFCH